MADYGAIARPYAQAVFELARESGDLSAWQAELDTAAAAVGTDEMERLLDTPGVDPIAIAGVIVAACSRDGGDMSEPGRTGLHNFIRLLAENHRLPVLPDIAKRFAKLKAEAQHMIDVTLTAASPVDQAEQAKMVEALKRRFGREVNLRFELDENLLGGARLQAEDLLIDGSVRLGLQKLASALAR